MITGLRRPAHWAAFAGAALAVVLIWWVPDFALPADLAADAGGTGLLVLNAAAVMLPGVYLS
ncbi:hypothetical protein ABT324_04175 [Saccharopolyspora sp. NPDC000359]|uniref:hypothetical protein n=1 Tax=Saccharopolyspora sp. NPDC000359 TaxID=3154251 RepID=UPI0033264DEA